LNIKNKIVIQTIDINLLKENPQLFFSQLPEKAETEILEFLRFVIFKYQNIEQKDEENNDIISDILPKKVKEFTPLNRDEIYAS